MGIDPKDHLVTALLLAPVEIREAALLRAWEYEARSPRYVLGCLETLQLLAIAARGAPSPAPSAPASGQSHGSAFASSREVEKQEPLDDEAWLEERSTDLLDSLLRGIEVAS